MKIEDFRGRGNPRMRVLVSETSLEDYGRNVGGALIII